MSDAGSSSHLKVALAAGGAVLAALLLRRYVQKRLGRCSAESNGYITPDKLLMHRSAASIWIVIDGTVYDVTKFIKVHPGGRSILFAFAGRDATDAFKTMMHSSEAMSVMKNLRIGEMAGPTASLSYGPKKHSSGHSRKTSLTGGVLPTADKIGFLWEVGSWGFLPCRDPVGPEALTDTPFATYAELGELLPVLAIDGRLHLRMDSDLDLQASLRLCGEPAAVNALNESQLERAFSLATYTMIAYLRGGSHGYGDPSATEGKVLQCKQDLATLPYYLAYPVLALSQKLGRPPMIDYASSVLYNWRRIDSTGPVSMDNVHCILRLTGLPDEEWFFKTHVIIESEAGHVVTAMLSALQSKTNVEMFKALEKLEEALWRVARLCLPIMYERGKDNKPRCSPSVFYFSLRPLISSVTVSFESSETSEARRLAGPSGAMSTLLPVLDAALGITMSSKKLQQLIETYEQSMPLQHREFLAEIRKTSSIRKRILEMRPASAGGPDAEAHRVLERSFNSVIARVLDFRWQHWGFIQNFIIRPGHSGRAEGTGGSGFDFLQAHINDTENARLLSIGNRIYSPGYTPSGLISPQNPLDLAEQRMDVTEQVVFSRQCSTGCAFYDVDGPFGLLAEPIPAPTSLAPLGNSMGWSPAMPSELHAAMRRLTSLAQRMPCLCANDGLFAEVCASELSVLSALDLVVDLSVLEGLTESDCERAYSLVTHLAAGCLANGGVVPERLQKTCQALAGSIGRPNDPASCTRPQFPELVLSNWYLTSDDEECARTGDIQVALRFLACVDEDWYRRLHIIIHARANMLMQAIRLGQKAMASKNDQNLIDGLQDITIWLMDCCRFMDTEFESKDSQSEPLMMIRLRKFIGTTEFSNEEQDNTLCWVYNMGSSVILPALHLLLGVLRVQSRLLDFFAAQRPIMPRSHRAFLESIEHKGNNMRRYCLTRVASRKITVERLYDLELAYNEALHALMRFCARRFRLAVRLMPDAERQSSLHEAHEEMIKRSRLHLLTMWMDIQMILERNS